jgi:hypothetical protein
VKKVSGTFFVCEKGVKKVSGTFLVKKVSGTFLGPKSVKKVSEKGVRNLFGA